MTTCFWTPPSNANRDSALGNFASYLKAESGYDWQEDYENLWEYSIDDMTSFWSHLWDWHGIIGTKGKSVLDAPDAMLGGQFFTDSHLNYAENMLRAADERPAIIAYNENNKRIMLSRRELKKKVLQLAGWMRSEGVKAGDRVAAYTPNNAEAVITMLAAASIGAVFSSCSSDFGFGGVHDRFGQIEPVILMAADGYHYNGKMIDRMDVVSELVAAIPSIKKVLLVPFLSDKPDTRNLPAVMFDDALDAASPLEEFMPLPFNHPLYIMYSSGTTGAPKCIVHGAGGTLIQHIKEHRLHCDVRTGDKVFYFTTCGWMMWNWLVSALAVEAAVVLYDGQPFYPDAGRLWKMAEIEELSLFGTSAKYIDALRKSNYRPLDAVDLSSLRQICSTGSPLSENGFAFVYEAVKPDVLLASISGGTDIISCFVLGCPLKAVYSGEIQARGLGMAVAVWDDKGDAIIGKEGELVCTKPFPSMPLGFWRDDKGEAYRNAYFMHYPGIWRHGDWAMLTDKGGIIIRGRSDATLNPGGVRIGTAEIYRQVEAFDEIAEALVVGQPIVVDGMNDVRVVLFVRLAEGAVLEDELKGKICHAIRTSASPRHVPQFVLKVADIPRTRSGKITELAVRDVLAGREIKNTEALANPEALEYFRNLRELKGEEHGG